MDAQSFANYGANQVPYQGCRLALVLLDRSFAIHVEGAVGVAVGVVVPVPEAAVPLLAHIVAESLENNSICKKRSIFVAMLFTKSTLRCFLMRTNAAGEYFCNFRVSCWP